MAYGEGFRRGGGGGGFRRGGGGFRSDFGPREMHKIKCSTCGKDAEVPFKPTGDRPVYCRDCFFKQKGITPREPRKEEAEEEKETEKGEVEEDSEDTEEEAEDSEDSE
ncbi:hypothetical protein HYT26_04395 [Candidatus Pacearchaeota archaeon]|nr:hypothetical protein [Candidatus Pacearchaeota archaeon]